MLDAIYRDARRRVADLAATLGAEQLRTPVPATPGWTVHDLLAHLVGGATDLSSGRLDGAPGDEWTARHVAELRHLAVGELLAQWERVAPTVETALSTTEFTGPNLAGDAMCHEADLAEALGLPRPDRAHWQPMLDAMMALLRRTLRDSPTLVIRDEGDREWSCGTGESPITLRADGYELLRGVFSRRSRRQISEWDWTPEAPPELIERFGFFGPRDDDQPVPTA